jgi:hypothetical protein
VKEEEEEEEANEGGCDGDSWQTCSDMAMLAPANARCLIMMNNGSAEAVAAASSSA